MSKKMSPAVRNIYLVHRSGKFNRERALKEVIKQIALIRADLKKPMEEKTFDDAFNRAELKHCLTVKKLLLLKPE